MVVGLALTEICRNVARVDKFGINAAKHTMFAGRSVRSMRSMRSVRCDLFSLVDGPCKTEVCQSVDTYVRQTLKSSFQKCGGQSEAVTT